MISPSLGQQYAEQVAEIYRDAELRILRQIADSLTRGVDSPEWERLQLARIQRVRDEAVRILNRSNPEAARRILHSLHDAYRQGGASAIADVGKYLDPIAALPPARAAAVAALAADTAAGLNSARPAILRGVDDIYRRVVAEVAASVATGSERRLEAVQRALDSFLAQGITSIETSRGLMSLDVYTTMAVRTAVARSALAGHLDTMAEMGLDLVYIEPGPRPCDICDAWARLVLSVNGEAGVHLLPNIAGTGEVEVTVDATLDDARADGWGHPNDRCNLGTYLPGVTDPSVVERPPWDEEGYEAQQQQRKIERNIRGWKTREAIAVTPEAQAKAAGKVDAWQGAMRDHLESNPKLKRQSKREQI